jgi:hypothetical protein
LFDLPFRITFYLNSFFDFKYSLKETVAATAPVLTTGQSQIWVDSDDNKVYLIYKPDGLTQVKVELT